MKRVIVTGAAGFVGRALVSRLLRDGLGGQPVAQLIAMDLKFDEPPADTRVLRVEGSVADATVRQRALVAPVDAVFHLASVPGGAAERDYEQGRRINLDATIGLLEDLRGSPIPPPRFVFASTVAVYGEHLSVQVDESTLPAPALSYGAHKLASEILVTDASRLGWVQGCSLRLPGVVARPGDGAGMMSAFMSQLFWKLAAGEALTVPVGPHGKAWWISVGACVDNLLHAACVEPGCMNARRSYQMPALWLSVFEVVEALAERFGPATKDLVRYVPDERIERLFAAYPRLVTSEAEALGFVHDASASQLVASAMEQA